MKTLITLLVLSLTLAANAQYGFQTISRTIGGGGDSFYTWAGKENSNNWYFADFMAGLTNAVADLQTRAGFTNVNYLRLVYRTTTNETDIATLKSNVASLQMAFTNSSIPFTLAGGSLYPSNTWSLASITNQMSNFSFWSGNSNGQALVTLSLSNGVVRYLQVLR